MKAYTTKAGATQYMPSFYEIEAMDETGDGFCLACGNEQRAEPDARRYECHACGARKVFGAQELALMGLFY
ncbi:MAG: hypothetical protein EB117_17345 [Betaproteobacteria bacterium]|nr:hypothetical protein [Betaproteobacteria bacterium]